MSAIWEHIAELKWVMDQISSHFERDLHDVVHRLSFSSSLSSLRLLFSAFLSIVSPSSNFTSDFSPSPPKLLAQRALFRLCYSSVSYLLLSHHLIEWWGSLLPSLPPLSLCLFCFASPSLSLSPSFSLSVSLFSFVSICGVKWGGVSQLSGPCWLACARCQARQIMTGSHRHLHSTSYTSQTYPPCPKERSIRSGDAKKYGACIKK